MDIWAQSSLWSGILKQSFRVDRGQIPRVKLNLYFSLGNQTVYHHKLAVKGSPI